MTEAFRTSGRPMLSNWPSNQGENAALDRAWQIEVERHRSQGTTAAFLGADAVHAFAGLRRVPQLVAAR
jgi:acyl-homoserine lactone acylase PvdQ